MATAIGPYSQTNNFVFDPSQVSGLALWLDAADKEVIIYTSLTSRQRTQVEGYLSWKWNLQKSLPSSHPFFNFPPG